MRLNILRRFRSEDRFLRNIGWMGLSEFGIRISRLLATVILARLLSPNDYGIAALVMMTHEFIRVFTRNGIGEKLVQAPASEVEEMCNTAFTLNWLLGILLFFIQTLGSFAAASFYGQSELIRPIILIGLTYLIYPLGSVQTSLILRENRMNVFGMTQLASVMTDNILIAIFALNGFGMWSIILPKFLVAPIWVIMVYRFHPWRPNWRPTLLHWRRILGFGSRILGVELLNTLRENIDYLLIGRFIGVSQLGIYYFAFNAGLGMSLSAVNAMGLTLYSDLCDVSHDRLLLQQRFQRNLSTIAKVIIPLVTLQASLAPLYVPIVFGQKWVDRGAVPILIVICLSALSRPFANAASMLFRSIGLPQVDLIWNLGFTLCLAVSVFVGTHYGIFGVAVAVMATHLLLQPLYALWAWRVVLLHPASWAS
ncbi:lipopolysaccharide biosynthesis protein [Synechococcus sp. Tobar12-5m-g]|uniref:lipopolysaccharide biosynthesis protein n=1 Tax=unclassified Synechococcus TaxID=2626047 RepID=UPI0020CD8274|nr:MULTISPECIES: lipopolysaccharide biosynthesis protein [unclassified Synechococcus]MCP9773224.1 lipopolysaccharide biosynthesis protein [Synechococcus sp. Tobar12-5m-g]MCP9874100.1 lipopolysaccharide biosynthesis protein [Synechococcus sp. Cruz CV-v-12]